MKVANMVVLGTSQIRGQWVIGMSSLENRLDMP
jgi:hypothetical protein